jgi:hypothetical protein
MELPSKTYSLCLGHLEGSLWKPGEDTQAGEIKSPVNQLIPECPRQHLGAEKAPPVSL